MTRVVVHVDRLVLQGFRPQDKEGIASGLQAELERALAGPGALAQWRAVGDAPRLQVRHVDIGPRSTPRHVGESVARGIGQEVAK